MTTSLHFFTPLNVERAQTQLRSRMIAEHARLEQLATFDTAQRLANLSGYYPSLNGGVLAGAAMAGLEPDDPQMADLALRELQQSVAALDSLRQKQQDSESPLLWNALKGVTRVGTLAFDFLWEEGLTRPLRTLVGVNQGMSWEEAYGLAGGSDALRALQSYTRGDPVNIGSGFLAQSNLSPETQAALDQGLPIQAASQNLAQQQLGTPITQIGREQRETGIQITSPGGVSVPVSPGRLLAINFAEPGSTMFGAVSGLADFSANIFLDPADKLLLGLGSMRDAAKTVRLNAPRRQILSRSWEQYVDSRDGRKAIDWFTEQRDIEPVIGALKSTQAYADPRLSAMLVESTDARTTQQLLRNGYQRGALQNALTPVSLTGRILAGGGTIGNRPIRAGLATGLGAAAGALPGGMGAARGAATAARMAPISGLRRSVGNVTKDTYLGYLSTRIGAHGLSVQDIDQAVDDFGENLVLMGLDRADRNELLLRLAKAGDAPTMFGVVRDAVAKFGDNLVATGIDPRITKGVTKLYDDYNEMSRFWMSKSKEPAFRPAAKVQVQANGKVVTVPSAHLFNEMMTQYIPILDPKKVRLAMKQANRKVLASKRSFDDWEALSDSVSTRLVDGFMTKVWKPLVLFRVAWPVRVITEEQIRMAALGLDSGFRHPLQYLSMMWAGGKAEDALGNPIEDARDWQAAMSRQIDLFGHKQPHTVAYREAKYGDPEFWAGRGFEFDQLARDPIAIPVADAILEGLRAGAKLTGVQAEDVLAGVKARFREGGDLAHYRWQMAHEGGRHAAFELDAIADGYIDSIMARIVDITGGTYIYNEAWGVQMTKLARDGNAELPDGLQFRIPGTEPSPGKGDVVASFAGRERWMDQFNDEVDIKTLYDMGLFQPNRSDWRHTNFPSGAMSPQVQALDETLAREAEEMFTFVRSQRNMSDEQIQAMLDEWADEIVRGTRDHVDDVTADRLAESIHDQLDPIKRELKAAVNGRVLDDYSYYQAVNDFRDEVARKVASPTEVRPLTDRELTQEFIPVAEAMRLGNMERGDFEALFSTIGEIEHWEPELLPGNVPDDVYRLNGMDWDEAELLPRGEPQLVGLGHADNMIAVVRDNQIVAQMSFTTIDGELARVALFSSVPPSHPLARRSDSAAIMRELKASLANPIDSALDLTLQGAGRRITVRQYLQALDVDDANLNSVEEVLAALKGGRDRLNPGDFPGLRGAELMSTTGGADAMGATFRSARGRSRSDPSSLLNVPQGRPQFVVTEMGDLELIEGIAKGRLRDIQLRDLDDPTKKIRRTLKANKPGSKAYDQDRRSLYSILEENIGERAQNSRTKIAVKDPHMKESDYDKVVSRIFDRLMGMPTDKLSRSPAFQQFYWKRMSALYGEVDEAGRAALLAQMRKEGITGKTLRERATDMLRGRDDDFAQIDRLAGAGRGGSRDLKVLDDAISLEEADDIAKTFAMHEVKDLLYDISRKHNFFEMTRNIFPFGEAWFEILSRWATIVAENPHIIRRMHQGLSGARESGWFYQDPQTGEEVFNYPGSGLLSNWMFGDSGMTDAGFQLTGRVQGLNLMLGQYMPGFGPMVQLPASTLARDWLEQPNQDFLRELLLPFGFTDADSMGQVVDSIAPSWLRKFLVAINKPTGDDVRLYNNTVMDVLRAGATTGDYNLNTQEGYTDALKDARGKARWLYFIRSAGAGIAPTAPAVRWEAQDINGQLWAFTSLAEEYRRVLDDNQGSQSEAMREFVQIFGLDPTGFITPKTVSVVRRSTTESGEDFRLTNKDLFEDYPMSAYYLRPDRPDDEFDYNAYLSQLRQGTRVGLTPEQWVFERNDLLGRIAYERAREHVGDNNTPEARTWLRDYRMQLMERYDGYNSPTLGFPETGTREATILEMERWVDDPRVAATEAGAGIVAYLGARQRSLEALASQGYSPSALSGANVGRIYRDWLRRTAQQIIDRYPSFVPAWVEVFSREIEDDDPEFLPDIAGVSF